MAVKFSTAELYALAGLPHLSVVLYMLGIRPRMDYKSGIVGEKPLISWQALRESTYEEPHQGIKHNYASGEACRRAAVWLEKAGLVEMRSRDRQLVFFLPLADTDESVQKKADRGTVGQAGRGPVGLERSNMGESNESSLQFAQPKTAKADEHPVSDNSTTLPPPLHSDKLAEALNEDGRQQDGPSFIFAKGIGSKQRVAITRKLSCLQVDIGQEVLDEWQAAMDSGEVRAPGALLRHFIAQAKAGEFMPLQGVKLHMARLNEKQVQLSLEKADEQLASEMENKGIKGIGKPPSLRAQLEEYREKPGRRKPTFTQKSRI